jgi:outer membrane lipopolysaccharide assembly protein LptE/RlpB
MNVKAEGKWQKAKRKIQKQKSKIQNGAVVGFLLLLVGGCGYQFSGKGAAFPEDVRTVFVEPFINRTREVGIELEITSALRSELYRRDQLQVVDRPEAADAVLSGVVRSVGARVVAVNRKDEVLQYELALVVDVSFRRRNPDEILWRTQGSTFTELFSGSRGAVVTSSSDFKSRHLNASDVRQFTDIQLTESLNQEAKERLVERFVRELHQRLMDMF